MSMTRTKHPVDLQHTGRKQEERDYRVRFTQQIRVPTEPISVIRTPGSTVMTSQIDYFSDMLEPEEPMVAVLGGPGAPDSDLGAIWYQAAVTPRRMLIVQLAQGGLQSSYQPTRRMVLDKAAVQVARYPRTDQSAARLEITGFEVPVTIIDIDRPDLFALVEPFIVAWGGRLEGAGTIRQNTVLEDPAGPDIDTGKLLLIGGLFVGLFMTCCGCSGVILLIKNMIGSAL